MAVLEPRSDEAVPAFWEALGLPGLFDVHVHFLPPPIMRRVREHFDAAGPLIGRAWPIAYRWNDDDLLQRLREMGVRRFTALPYAHRPGIAAYLNEWAASFASQHADVLRSATFYPEPTAAREVGEAISLGVQVFKVHVQVGGFDLRDPLLDEAWARIAEAGVPVVIHAGSGPVANAHTGPAPVAEVLARHPRLVAVIAHCGAPEYEEFFQLAEGYDNVYLDTTMVFTPFFDAIAPFPTELLGRLELLRDKILLGSDFPNIPYAYAVQLASLARLGAGEDWLRSVVWHNASRLFSTVHA